MRYIAMNNFQIAADQTEPFEERWRRRRSYLQGAPGFESFQLLRGESHDGTIHYVSHSTWASKEATDWRCPDRTHHAALGARSGG